MKIKEKIENQAVSMEEIMVLKQKEIHQKGVKDLRENTEKVGIRCKLYWEREPKRIEKQQIISAFVAINSLKQRYVL